MEKDDVYLRSLLNNFLKSNTVEELYMAQKNGKEQFDKMVKKDTKAKRKFPSNMVLVITLGNINGMVAVHEEDERKHK